MSYRLQTVEFDDLTEPETIQDKLLEEGLRPEIFEIVEVDDR